MYDQAEKEKITRKKNKQFAHDKMLANLFLISKRLVGNRIGYIRRKMSLISKKHELLDGVTKEIWELNCCVFN